jgi:hypothetical protein
VSGYNEIQNPPEPYNADFDPKIDLLNPENGYLGDYSSINSTG